MALTLAAVMLLVTSGNVGQLVVAWVGTALGLNRLLLFYADRPQARRAARKKALTARMGDAAVIAAAVVMVSAFDTGDITTLNAVAAGPWAMLAAALLALAAVLKSAQFPLHGWLTEVMETPTPVSALLHAGIVNAGGFLLIRFADVMLTAPGVLALLVVIGGFTALIGGLVMLTQPAVKTALAWSTIAQMGFMILQCGLALFPLALLHIVAHSLYKAHAFLSSGSAVEDVAAVRRPGAGGSALSRGGAAGLRARSGDIRGYGSGVRGGREVPSGACSGRDPDLRGGLSDCPRPGGYRAESVDPAGSHSLGLCGGQLLCAATRGRMADGGHVARDASAGAAGMGADRAGGVQLWRGGAGAGDVPALGPASGGAGDPRASGQRALCKCDV